MFISGSTLWDQTAEKAFEIATYSRVGILVDGQRGRGMLQPQMQQSDSTTTQFRQTCKYLVRHQMKPAGPCPEGDSGLMPHTVLRTFGAHSNSTEKKAKRAINKLIHKLTIMPMTALRPLPRQAAIIANDTDNGSSNARMVHKVRIKKMPGETGHFSAATVDYKL
ncbi:hypothetical protein PSCICJ_23410 [Pseudomonas cichorii]|nr:hypothetical protein PSCICJ_23410 [Pseudomonas cichorii]